jgi:GH25 family lysozyme M1 (1,4-beta-N-acetylmuramidase)
LGKILKYSLWSVVALALIHSVPMVDAEEVTTSSSVESTTTSFQEQNTESTTENESITNSTETTNTEVDTSEASASSESETENPSTEKPDEVKEAVQIDEYTQHAMGGKTYSDVHLKARSATPYASITDQSLPRTDFIDVSSWNGNITVDMYRKIKSYGVTGVVVKLTEGTTYRNPYAPSQIANAKAAGLKVSVYHFARYRNASEAQAEAAYFARFARELGLPSSTVMVNDIEAAEIKANATDNSLSFYFATHANGYGTMIHYSSASWFSEGTLSMSRLGGATSVWVAQYPYTPSKNNLLHTNCAAWQWASTMTFPGVNAPISFDVSIDYTNRFSSRSSLPTDMTYKPGDKVLFGDWDGDGKDTVAIKRGDTFYFKNNLSGGQADIVLKYGNPTDDAIVGDWNGDGKDTIAVRRGLTFYFKNDLAPGDHDIKLSYGNSSDDAIAGDWNGDGRDTVAVRRGNTFYFKNNLLPGDHDIKLSYGNTSDQILVGDWNRSGRDSIAVRRGNINYLKYNLTDGWHDLAFGYGRPADKAFAGDWNGNGQDTVLVQQGSVFQVKNSLSGGVADLSFRIE